MKYFVRKKKKKLVFEKMIQFISTLCWGCGTKATKSSPMKPHLVQGPSIVSQSPDYLRSFHRKELASRRSPGTIKAQVRSDWAEVLEASDGRTGGR
jgi:hypothetical protein